LTGSRKALESSPLGTRRCTGRSALRKVPSLGATTKSLGVRLGRPHQTTARTAVMKAKAAQIEIISTLIADVIDEPPEVQMKRLGSESANSFSMTSSVKI
jgi:hypothetical protein